MDRLLVAGMLWRVSDSDLIERLRWRAYDPAMRLDCRRHVKTDPQATAEI